MIIYFTDAAGYVENTTSWKPELNTKVCNTKLERFVQAKVVEFFLWQRAYSLDPDYSSASLLYGLSL